MLKIAGSVLVMLACLGYAGGLLRQMSRRRDILRSCLEMTELLAGEIRYERAPVAEALRRICGRLDGDLETVIRGIADRLEEGGYGSMEEVWDAGFLREKEKLPLTKEELDGVREIGKNLGFLDLAVQIDHLAGCRERLGRNLDKVQRELDEKRRLYRSLGLAAGIFVILILL